MPPLLGLLREEILATGPIPLARYMDLCLGHPVHGYYRTRDPLGAAGDFVTAPEISQMFGELIGLWIASVWGEMGAPADLALVELGPGRGTLMADALRALSRVAPTLAPRLHLVETSPVLKAAQAERLPGFAPTWHDDLATLPPGPAIVVANEFFDALPVRQFQRGERGWHERCVGLSPDGQGLAFGLAAEPDPHLTVRAPLGVILTLPGAALDTMRDLARRFVRDGGALLAIDYGHARPGFGDSLQAVAEHRFVDPLAAPGSADLTTHVDFSALARAASGEGARVHGPVDQRDFLQALGLHQRAERLSAGATPEQAAEIAAAVSRLIDPTRRGMGSLFKVLAVSDRNLVQLPGLPQTDETDPETSI
ncbi:class I SAM-dependent methyltransferase [Methylobacterium gossipiicola]|uniref:SAM-dependent methyltransferase, MidA family n=1 Tax=Methylobacterium gossipiicola TaxID=582675 RepID=A0A1I2QH25_9HYPH|nr:class I SAM-dependent methyltransferase [Methylobacterium gossipiicola]SFG25537.1 SAM-dependent methyltransferase, MidA family [Methylobacterium gossipiicola]